MLRVCVSCTRRCSVLKGWGLAPFLLAWSVISHAAQEHKPVVCNTSKNVEEVLKEHKMQRMFRIITENGFIVFYRSATDIALVEYFNNDTTTACLIDSGRIDTNDNSLRWKGA
jgi:hypothetical protein